MRHVFKGKSLLNLVTRRTDRTARRAATRPDDPNGNKAVVGATRNESYDIRSFRTALRNCLDNLEHPLSHVVKYGDRVLVKVNMGCSGARDPAFRQTTHPTFVEATIEALLDCGARVGFGDDVARVGLHADALSRATGMATVATRTGATLVDFVARGAREVASGLYTRPRIL